jgi:integral membrane sensor domain MASE1
MVQELIFAAVLGVMLGWPVAGVAFLPLALLILLSPRLGRSFAILLALCAVLLAAVARTDQYFYGRPTVRLHLQ